MKKMCTGKILKGWALLLAFMLTCSIALGESQDVVTATVDGYTFTYADELPVDIICVPNDQTADADLQFYKIFSRKGGDAAALVFTMTLNQDVGDIVWVAQQPQGEMLMIAFDMGEPAESLSSREVGDFYTAQEKTNVIISTLQILSVPTPEMLQVVENASKILIEKEEYTLQYAGEMAKRLIVEEQTDGKLHFFVRINGQQEHVFAIRVGEMDGDIVNMLKAEDGSKVPVSAYMDLLPEHLNQNNGEFYMAQDAVIDILSGITLN